MMTRLIHTLMMLLAWPFLILSMALSVSVAVVQSIAAVWIQKR